MPQETFTPQALRTRVEELGLDSTSKGFRAQVTELTPQQKRNAERKVFMQLAKDRLAELDSAKEKASYPYPARTENTDGDL